MKRFWILMLLASVSACSHGIGSTSNDGTPPVELSEEQALPVSMHSQNYLMYGGTIHTNVLASYQPVIDFYGDDSQLFKDLVAANLSTVDGAAQTTQSGIPLSYFDILNQFPDATLVITLNDGTKTNYDIGKLILDENKALDLFNSIKKDVKSLAICGKMPSADTLTKDINAIAKCAPVQLNSQALSIASNLTNFLKDSSYQGLFTFATDLSKTCSFIAAGIDLANALGLFGSLKDPTQEKLDYIVNALQVINAQLTDIQNTLTSIENMLTQAQRDTFNFNLSSTVNQINSFVQELSNSSTTASKQQVAGEFRMYINGLMANYIDYAIEVTQLQLPLVAFTDSTHTQYTDDYKPIVLSFNMPYSDNFGYYHRVGVAPGAYVYSTVQSPIANDYKLAQVTLDSPNLQLPINYAHLVYLQNLIITRMNMNSLVEDGANLDQYNSNVAKTYLTDTGYILKIKSSLLTSFTKLKSDLDAGLANLENSKNNQKLMSDNLGKASWVFTAIQTGSAGSYGWPYQVSLYSSTQKTPVKYNADTFTPASFNVLTLNASPSNISPYGAGLPPILPVTVLNPFLLLTAFNPGIPVHGPAPVMSSDPYTMYSANVPIEGGLTDVVYQWSQTLNNPKI